MVRTDLLKGEIAKAGYSQAKIANELGITPKTFYAKMKKGVFNSDEIEDLISLLRIENPVQVFFAQKVTQ